MVIPSCCIDPHAHQEGTFLWVCGIQEEEEPRKMQTGSLSMQILLTTVKIEAIELSTDRYCV
jgi:hypothetical protein